MSLDAPYFSVVVPCYKAAATLPETVESVLVQSFTDFEVLLLIDGCPDGTLDVARRLAKSDSRVVVIAKENGGVSSARNVGIRSARGHVIAFLDADDIWLPDKLARHHQLFESEPSVMVSYAQIRFLTPEGLPTNVTSNRPTECLHTTLLLAENVTCTTSNLLARSEVFGRVGVFHETLHFDEDKEWIFRAYATGERFKGLGEILTGYRTSPNGLASDLDQMEQDWLRYVEIVRAYQPGAVAMAFPEAQALFLRNLARRALRLRLPGRKALELFCRAVGAQPEAVLVETRRWLMIGVAALTVAVLPSGLAQSLMARFETVPTKRSQPRGA